MRTKILAFFFCLLPAICLAQTTTTTVYELIQKLMYDSTGWTNVGNWGVGKPATYPVKWQADRIEMSDDTSINFFRKGTAGLTAPKGLAALSGPWSVMLKGARSGYTSFTLLSEPVDNLPSEITLEMLFEGKPFSSRLLKRCSDEKARFHYYEVKIAGKDPLFLKLSVLDVQGKRRVRLDGYDDWSRYAVKLDCSS